MNRPAGYFLGDLETGTGFGLSDNCKTGERSDAIRNVIASIPLLSELRTWNRNKIGSEELAFVIDEFELPDFIAKHVAVDTQLKHRSLYDRIHVLWGRRHD